MKQKINSSVNLLVLCASVFPFLASVFFLSSCLDPEKPMPLIPEPVLQGIEINASGLATHYYSMAQKRVVASVKVTDWDLKLCGQKDKYYIYLNTAKNMRIAKYNGKFSDAINYKDIPKWKSDLMKDGKCLAAMGSWGDFSFTSPKSFGYTYIIDLGYVNTPNEFGYRKIEVLGFTDNHYILKYGELDDPYGDTIMIEKTKTFSYSYLKFDSKAAAVSIEPPSYDWDLVFTHYGLSTQVIKDGTVIDTAFTLTDMVLLNTEGRQIACDSMKAFDDITFWDAEKYTYSSAMDYIGNHWRYYNAAHNQFEVSNKNIYVIKNTKNHLYLIELKSVDKSTPGTTSVEFMVKNL